MKYLFIPPLRSLDNLLDISKAFQEAGYKTQGVKFGISWDAFLRDLPDGATVVVYSVDFFPSLMELLSTLATLQERGISLQSLQEPWLSAEIHSTTEFLVKLKELAVLLHQNRTRAGLAKARAAGKTLGRPVGYRKVRR